VTTFARNEFLTEGHRVDRIFNATNDVYEAKLCKVASKNAPVHYKRGHTVALTEREKE